MPGEDPEWVVVKVPEGYELGVADPLQPQQRQLALLLKPDVVPRSHDWIEGKLPELCSHLLVVVVEERHQLVNREQG